MTYHAISEIGVLYMQPSLVPRPIPDIISQSWRKISRRPGTISTKEWN